MKKIFTLFLFSILFAIASLSVYAQEAGNATCPVMPGEEVKEKFFVDHQGKRVFMCCRNCVNKFKANPEKYTQFPETE